MQTVSQFLLGSKDGHILILSSWNNVFILGVILFNYMYMLCQIITTIIDENTIYCFSF